MKLFCTASKDTYITNKIINNRLVADDANVGRAGTLDLFRLYSETTLRGSGSQDEVSRLLIKFDLSPAIKLTGSILDINSNNFSAVMKLFDVRSGHAVPSNFNISIFPLSRSFDEGVGRDISSFGDIDAANFLTSSYSNGSANLWHMSGANKTGLLGSDDADIISSGNLLDGDGVVDLWKSQLFKIGTEDLVIDVTKIVSATIAGNIPNEGFRLSYSGTEETDDKSRFVKRFAARHVVNPHIRPRIEVSFDESIQDNHGNFLFDVSGSLFLQNFARSSRANIVSGSNLSEISGDDCMIVKLKKGNFEFTSKVSQHTQGTGGNEVKGLYSASFAIPSNTPDLYNKTSKLSKLISDKKEVIFEEFWYSNDETVGYHTGSVKIKIPSRNSNYFSKSDPDIWSLNVKTEYHHKDTDRIRVYGIDYSNDLNSSSKIPRKREADIFDETYYRIKDRDSGKIIFDFGESDNSTKVSTDSEGMFFDIKFSPLPRGRTYQFEFLVIHRGIRLIVEDNNANFRIL